MTEVQAEIDIFGKRQPLRGQVDRLGAEIRACEKQILKVKEREHVYKRWKRVNFDALTVLNQTQNPIIEVAGPTLDGYKIIDITSLKNRIAVSNLSSGLPIYDRHTGEPLGYVGHTDFVANAESLPFPDSSLGGIFFSHFYSDRFLEEAERALSKGGLLIAQGLSRANFNQIQQSKLVLQEYTIRGSFFSKTYDVIFQKTEINQP